MWAFEKSRPESTYGGGKKHFYVSQQLLQVRNWTLVKNLLILKTAMAYNISCHTSHDGNIQRRSNFTIVCKEKERDVIFRLGEKVSFRCNQQIKLVSKSSSCQEMRGFPKKKFAFSNEIDDLWTSGNFSFLQLFSRFRSYGESDFAHMLFVDEEHFSASNVGVGSKFIVLLRALSRTQKTLMKRLYSIELKKPQKT